jgi:periplasmic protein TonB
VSSDLFRQIVEHRPPVPARRLSALPLSILVHATVLFAVIVIPLLASDVLPAIRGNETLWTPVALPPAPPPLPVPAARRISTEAVVDAAAPPVEAPNGIARERLIVSETPLDVTAPQAGGSVPGIDLPGGLGTVVPEMAPPVRPSAPVRVSSLIKPPVKVRDVSPVYPEAARLARVEGLVVIEAVIGPTGDVQEAKILRSKPLLDEAALAAVRQWKYTPTLLSGVPVPVIMTVTVNFSLR